MGQHLVHIWGWAYIHEDGYSHSYYESWDGITHVSGGGACTHPLLGGGGGGMYSPCLGGGLISPCFGDVAHHVWGHGLYL